MNRLLYLTVILFYLVTNKSFVLGINKPANNSTCQTDEDCAVKDVGNCCGYYPKCVNKEFEPDRDAVKQWCKELEMVSICGFPSIDSCICDGGVCKAGIPLFVLMKIYFHDSSFDNGELTSPVTQYQLHCVWYTWVYGTGR